MTLADRLREEGMNLGRQEGLYQTAVNLLNLGQELSLISRATGLSIKEIQELQDKE